MNMPIKLKDYGKYWDNINKIPIHDVGHILRRKEISRHIPPNSKNILSIGSGYGEELLLFRKERPDANIFCVDLSAKALEKCKALLSAKTFLSDAQNLHFKNNMFDCIVILEVLEHLQDDQKAVKEINRVLKSGGVVIASVPSPPFTDKDMKNGHLRVYGRDEFLNLFEKNGFEHKHDINYYDRLRFFYNPTKKIIRTLNSVQNKLFNQNKEYVEHWIYGKAIKPLFIFLAKLEEKKEPLRRKNIAVFEKAEKP